MTTWWRTVPWSRVAMRQTVLGRPSTVLGVADGAVVAESDMLVDVEPERCSEEAARSVVRTEDTAMAAEVAPLAGHEAAVAGVDAACAEDYSDVMRWLESCWREDGGAPGEGSEKVERTRAVARSAVAQCCAELTSEACEALEREARVLYAERRGPLPGLPCDEWGRVKAHVHGLMEMEVEARRVTDARTEPFVPGMHMDLEPHELGADGEPLPWWPPARR